VALNKKDYINKMEEMFDDRETYELIAKDPIKKLTKDIGSLLGRWKSKGYISKTIYNSVFLCSDGNLPRAYGLPKVHKPGFVFRVIISSIDNPTYKLAKFLHKIISKNISKPRSHIENSFQLTKELNRVTIDSDYDLISLDVISLFTNIPISLALEGLTKRWNEIKRETSIPINEFMEGVKMRLDSTVFTFNKKIYKQKFGTPMGSPMLPVIANIVMEDIETRALHDLNIDIPFYYRYVDDCNGHSVPRFTKGFTYVQFTPSKVIIYYGNKW